MQSKNTEAPFLIYYYSSYYGPKWYSYSLKSAFSALSVCFDFSSFQTANRNTNKLWQSLQYRRKVARLTLLHKTLQNEAAVNILLYIEHKPTLKTRRSHPLKFLPLHTNCDAYKYSFWPSTIQDWNNLEPVILDIIDTKTFKNIQFPTDHPCYVP